MSEDQSVLVVEDDEGLANIIALILGQEGFEVRTAHNGTLGYFAYFHDPTEWVVTDIQMPELDGLQMIAGHPVHQSQCQSRLHEWRSG